MCEYYRTGGTFPLRLIHCRNRRYNNASYQENSPAFLKFDNNGLYITPLFSKGNLKGKRPLTEGFSLVETVMAFVFLALALGSILVFFSNTLVMSRKISQRSIALNLAREKLEERSLWPVGSSELRAAVSDFSGFERQVDVQMLAANLARITVTVWWDNGTQSESLETYKADY